MELFKLVNQNKVTYNNFQYGSKKGTKHSKPKINNPRLCSSDVFHAYKNIFYAVTLRKSKEEFNFIEE